MEIKNRYLSDVEEIISHRYDNGGDLWTTPDHRVLKGSPFSTIGSAHLLLELGVDPKEDLLIETANILFKTWQRSGQFKVYPKGSMYPCQTAHVARTLCHLGYAFDKRIQKTFHYLLDIQHSDGGWRCNKFSYGRGPETEFSNPFPTLTILDAFRYSEYINKEPKLDMAVEFLLEHWRTRKPIGPCHYGIGKLFMQVEYPFSNYNIFIYVYVLSFYNKAKKDSRFLDALKVLESKMVDGQIVVERNVSKLSTLSFCQKGEPSALATKRYHEILINISKLY